MWEVGSVEAAEIEKEHVERMGGGYGKLFLSSVQFFFPLSHTP